MNKVGERESKKTFIRKFYYNKYVNKDLRMSTLGSISCKMPNYLSLVRPHPVTRQCQAYNRTRFAFDISLRIHCELYV